MEKVKTVDCNRLPWCLSLRVHSLVLLELRVLIHCAGAEPCVGSRAHGGGNEPCSGENGLH